MKKSTIQHIVIAVSFGLIILVIWYLRVSSVKTIDHYANITLEGAEGEDEGTSTEATSSQKNTNSQNKSDDIDDSKTSSSSSKNLDESKATTSSSSKSDDIDDLKTSSSSSKSLEESKATTNSSSKVKDDSKSVNSKSQEVDNNIQPSCPVRSHSISSCKVVLDKACPDQEYAILKDRIVEKSSGADFADKKTETDPNKKYCYIKSFAYDSNSKYFDIPNCSKDSTLYNIPHMITNVYPGTLASSDDPVSKNICIMEIDPKYVSIDNVSAIATGIQKIENKNLFEELAKYEAELKTLRTQSEEGSRDLSESNRMAKDAIQNSSRDSEEKKLLIMENERSKAQINALTKNEVIIYFPGGTTNNTKYYSIPQIDYNKDLMLDNIVKGEKADRLYIPPESKATSVTLKFHQASKQNVTHKQVKGDIVSVPLNDVYSIRVLTV